MKNQFPDKLFGKPIKGSLEGFLAKEEEVKQEGALTQAPNMDGFIYVPSVKLYVAKERSHLGKNWYEAHRDLNGEGCRMLIIPEFVEFLKYLKANSSDENNRILDDIIAVRSPWRAEWLDAKFEESGSTMNVSYGHRMINGKLELGKTEELSDALMEDKEPGIDLNYWLSKPGLQGLPTKDTPDGDLYYWHPRSGKVAGFYAGSDWAVFVCSWNPGYANASLGVRAAREKI
jgi:hypothetical protein